MPVSDCITRRGIQSVTGSPEKEVQKYDASLMYDKNFKNDMVNK